MWVVFDGKLLVISFVDQELFITNPDPHLDPVPDPYQYHVIIWGPPRATGMRAPYFTFHWSRAVLRIRDVYPGKTATKERGEKKWDVKPFYVATKFNKIVNYFSFELPKKKICANFQKMSKSSSKYGLGIRDPEKTHSGYRIPDPGVKKAPDPGSRIRIRITAFKP